MEKGKRRDDDRNHLVAVTSALEQRLPLPPPLPLDDDEPWWVLPSPATATKSNGDDGFELAGGAPATTTPLAAMLFRVAVDAAASSSSSSSSSTSSTSSSASLPLPHADAALAMRLLEEEPEKSVAACQSLFDHGGTAALTAVAASCPALAAAAASAAAIETKTREQQQQQHDFPDDLSLFEASQLASAWLDAFLRAPVTLQWAEAASKLSSSGASASWRRKRQQQQQSSSTSTSTTATATTTTTTPTTMIPESNLLPPASFARATVSRALQAAQANQQEQERHRIASSSPSASSSSPGPSVVGSEASATTRATGTSAAAAAAAAAALPPQRQQQQTNDFAPVRLAVALVRSMLRSPSARKALSDAASRCELEAFCLASAASRDAAALYRDLKAGTLFR